MPLYTVTSWNISSVTLVFQDTLTGIATIPVLLWDKYSYFGCHGRLLTVSGTIGHPSFQLTF